MSFLITDEKLNQLQMRKKVVARTEKPPAPIPEVKVDENVKATRELAGAIRSLAETPQQTDLTPLLAAMVKMQETQQEILSHMNQPKDPPLTAWEFSVERNRNGSISKIHAKAR